MTLAAAYSSYAAASGFGVPEMSLLEPGNVRHFLSLPVKVPSADVPYTQFNLLFPGEALGTGKRSVWALYLRAMLLWLACLRMRAGVEGAHQTSVASGAPSTVGYGVYDGGRSSGMHDREIAEFAMKAWLETEAIERALSVHTCGVEPAMLYHGREYLFKYVSSAWLYMHARVLTGHLLFSIYALQLHPARLAPIFTLTQQHPDVHLL